MTTLDAQEFIRRFLLHTPPGGFHRVRTRRHVGWNANSWSIVEYDTAPTSICARRVPQHLRSPSLNRGTWRLRFLPLDLVPS